MALNKRGRIWWWDFTDHQSKVRYRESSKTRDELIAGLLEARRKVEVADASRLAVLEALGWTGGNASSTLNNQTTSTPITQALNQLEATVKKATEDQRPICSISGLRDEWLEAKAHNRTIEYDRSKLQRFIDWLEVELIPIHELTTTTIRAYIGELEEDHKPASVNRHIALLRACFNLAKRKGYRHNDPMAAISMLPENNERDRIATDAEVETLVAGAAENGLKLAIVLARQTGMRRAEIAGLDEKHYRHEPEPHFVLSGAEVKNKQGRVIPLTTKAQDAWKLYGGSVGMTANAISKRFGELCVAVGIEGLHFHDLRGTFATSLLQGGMDSLVVGKLGGWKELSTLNKRYARLGGKALLEVYKDKNLNKTNT